jgi:hypothetical protein
MAEAVVVLATGDLIIDEPDPDLYFEPARPTLAAADVVVGHVEVPFTLEREGSPNVPLDARDPRKLSALGRAGVHVASLAANHLYDEGQAGVRDTLAGLCEQGIALWQVAIAIAAVLAGALIPGATEEVVDFRFERGLDHLAGSLAHDHLEHIVGRRHWRGRGQNLIRFGRGVSFPEIGPT